MLNINILVVQKEATPHVIEHLNASKFSADINIASEHLKISAEVNNNIPSLDIK